MSADPDPLIGRRLVDRYRIDALLARGGMSRVYRARDERLERDVAVKVLSSPYAEDGSFVERFLDEARSAASLSHPSLVHVYDSGSDDGAHFFVMELLDRHRTLRDVLDERGPLDPDRVLRIGRELLAGLSVVHGRDLVHCDVKSANVMLGPGPAKLIDFGIATAPHDGLEGDTSIGSLHFMSPEQLQGEALTPASDLFSLGAVLYEALTGRPPYPGETPEEVSAAHAAERVRAPSDVVGGLPRRLDDAILQSLRRNPEARFRSAEAMSVALSDADGALDEPRLDDDETRVVRTGYVPPAAPQPRQAPRSDPPPPPRSAAPPAPARRPMTGRRRTRSANPWGLIGTVLVLAAAALVVVFVVVPLLQLGSGGDAGDPPGAATAEPTAPPAGDTVAMPTFVGQPTADAIELARGAELNWTVFCNHDESRPEGIVDQEPAAGTAVRRGAAISLYSARISDCE